MHRATPRPPIVILGEALIDCIALEKDSDHSGAFMPHLGGSPYNVARAVAKQHGAVWFLNPLSNDEFGVQLSRQHAQDGVNPGLDGNALPTSLAMVSFVSGQPSYQFYREGVADRAFSSDEALHFLKQFPRPGILHTGSLALVPPEADKTLSIVQAAKALGWTISVDINVRMRLAKDLAQYRASLWDFIKVADWLKASDEDLTHLLVGDACAPSFHAKTLTLENASTVAEIFCALGAQKIALTFGGQGAFLQCDADVARGKAPVVVVVDTVGAGDTFWGTCLRLWSQNPDMASSTVLNTAMHAAAINCTFAGCHPPNLTALDEAH